MVTPQSTRNNLLTNFGKTVLKDRYLLQDEDYQDLFVRVATFYGDNEGHAQRMYDYMSQLWFMPATPILSNGGTNRGLPISCFLNESDDSLEGIANLWYENIWLASKGGGIGSYWGNLRAIGETVGKVGKTSGIIPFIKVQDSMTLAISQGNLRRGSAAGYLPINHPEIEEFIDLRKPTGGDPNRKCLNIHHGVTISNAFMRAVEIDAQWDLISPHDKSVISTVSARNLWIKLITTRLETGEPYMVFEDTVNSQLPESYNRLDLLCKTSNLCSEITLATGKDHLNNDRTAVCCLGSINLEKYDSWKDNKQFIEDIARFQDNVLQDFINRAPSYMSKAIYSAQRERSIGIGVMGFHSYLQSKNISFESALAKSFNMKVFKHIRGEMDKASVTLAIERGSCLDAQELGLQERFTHKLAVAPTASISIICGTASPGIEPFAANTYTAKTLSGSITVRNKYLDAIIKNTYKDPEKIWLSISRNNGSVSHLDLLTKEQKEVFKTAYELDQRWIIDHAADRTQYICQASSTNIFLAGNTDKTVLHNIHYRAWKKGLKSLYYCRSTSIQRAESVNNIDIDPINECLSCQ